jgi:hypothetical protein
MAHRSTGLFPRKAAYVDAATILTAGSSTAFAIPTGVDSLGIVAYFSSTAAGYAKITDQSDNLLATITAPSGGGMVLIERSGFELAKLGVTGLKLVTATFLTAGTVQVSLDASAD